MISSWNGHDLHEQHHREQGAPAAEVQPGQGVAGQDAEDDGAEQDAGGEDAGVQQRLDEVHPLVDVARSCPG